MEGGELNPILEPCYPLRGYPIGIWIGGRASTVNSFLAAPPTRGGACFNNELQVTYKSTLTGFCGRGSDRNSVCDLQAFIQGNPSHKHNPQVSQAKQERCVSLLHLHLVSPLSPPQPVGRSIYKHELRTTLTGLVMGCGVEPLSVPGRADAIADRQILGDSRYTRDAEPRLQFFPRYQPLIFPTISPRQPVEGLVKKK